MSKIETDDPAYDTWFQHVPNDKKDLVIKGHIALYEGRDERPVMRWTAKAKNKHAGAMVPGSGLHPNIAHGVVDQKYSYKRTNAYKELKEYLVPATDDPEVRGSVGWLFEKAFDMIEGGDVLTKATCPECSHSFTLTTYKRGDSKALQTVIDQVLDKPAQRQEIALEGNVLHEYLNSPTEANTIEVYEVSPENASERRKLLESPNE